MVRRSPQPYSRMIRPWRSWIFGKANEGHVLVVPKRHFEQIYDLEEEIASALGEDGAKSGPCRAPRLRAGGIVDLAVEWCGCISGSAARTLAPSSAVHERWPSCCVSQGRCRPSTEPIGAVSEEHRRSFGCSISRTRSFSSALAPPGNLAVCTRREREKHTIAHAGCLVHARAGESSAVVGKSV